MPSNNLQDKPKSAQGTRINVANKSKFRSPTNFSPDRFKSFNYSGRFVGQNQQPLVQPAQQKTKKDSFKKLSAAQVSNFAGNIPV